jgi:hypothetical protein
LQPCILLPPGGFIMLANRTPHYGRAPVAPAAEIEFVIRQAQGAKNQASFFYFLGSASAADLDDLCADGLTH